MPDVSVMPKEKKLTGMCFLSEKNYAKKECYYSLNNLLLISILLFCINTSTKKARFLLLKAGVLISKYLRVYRLLVNVKSNNFIQFTMYK